MSRLALLATIAIGCGHPDARASPAHASAPATADAAIDAPLALEDDLPRLAERAVTLYRDWKLAFEQAGTDCAQATAKMNAIADANADVIEANRNIYARGHERVKALRAELAKHQAELDAAAQAIMQSQTLATCSMDPAFARALERLGGEG